MPKTRYVIPDDPAYWRAEPRDAKVLAERVAAKLRERAAKAGYDVEIVAGGPRPADADDPEVFQLLYVAEIQITRAVTQDYHWMTPVEVAAETGTEESVWRKRAARGDVPGAVKKGKQWLLPRLELRKQGHAV